MNISMKVPVEDASAVRLFMQECEKNDLEVGEVVGAMITEYMTSGAYRDEIHDLIVERGTDGDV